MATLALAGDTMLGRGVTEHLATHPVGSLFGDDLLEIVAATDGVLLNLECCISECGEPWPDRMFHFRAPPWAIDALNLLGVRCVTLANNHALDFGEPALLDTLEHLRAAGTGPRRLTRRSRRSRPSGRVRGHPRRVGVAYADIRDGVPRWLTDILRRLSTADAPLLVCPHWGPDMARQPLSRIRRAAHSCAAPALP